MNRCEFHKNRGSGLAQYGIIIAIVAVVVVPGFFLVGKNVVESFNGFSACLRGDSESATNTSTTEGTSVFSVEGQHIEVEMPDVQEFIQTTGSSGDDIVNDTEFLETAGVASDEPTNSTQTAETTPLSVTPEPVAVLESPGVTSIYVGRELPSDYSDTPEETSGSPGIAVPTEELTGDPPPQSI